MGTPNSVCVHCKMGVMFSVTIKDEWTHFHGGTYCLDNNGFTATPLRKATPVFHEEGSVL